MSSSSDIEKLFDHFGGDANAYQEIGRENEAHTARTRWPLLVTLDLRQPPIPAIGQHAQTSAKPEAADDEPAAAAPAAARQDAAPKDAVSVMRAKAPLFTRSPRRDIPPVVAAVAAPAGPRGAARFGTVDTSGTTARVSPSRSAADLPPASADSRIQAQTDLHAKAGTAGPATATVRTVTPAVAPMSASLLAARSAATSAATARSTLPPVSAFTSASASASAPASAATPEFEPTPAATHTSAPPSTSILGKLFSRQDDSAPTRAAAPAAQPVALQSLFDRLRGTPHGTAASARAPEAAAPNSWLVNGPRRS
ncbi:cellulose biosynthesis protein BcsP [Paraburkholderia phenoliruptrix]|uniref:cellulose biosynthesis protein BcsP n=1 Tax=Paraburkholderia phenoliruptrix TaxID=252970 RepID=UPI001C6E2A42|nr:cellulose biosynthesis protein BcsP [Paraburkholderia phenoliruptrix]MBW9102545.1 hypothetical protein [Paraburkholderia phenoliruptrix]MBW9127766.1 hypothetical protein [Paraburkholderia ginsengiterrae]